MAGYVYLICDPCNDKFKIGVTTGKIEKRIKELQTGNPNELFISNYHKTEYPFKLETMLHAKYRTNNVLNEWFEIDSHDVSHFNEICIELENAIETLKNNPYFFKS